ncbi:MAG: type II secretion system protein [Peptoniphilus sp.]|nr:type II secretion system protein [Peptoniphilus sp.]MDD7363846.1 type II secretion system protein [Bacillota bacterium]MDY6044315.1 type II secretion system protein [Peptoniphilus sp.]
MKNKIPAMSLIEVVCVIAILAVVTTAATLGFQGVQRFKAERQLHIMADELNDLRFEAMSGRCETKLIFSPSGYRRVVGEERAEEIPYESELEFLRATTAKGENMFSFSASGRPSNSGTSYFQIGGAVYGIVLSPVNAHIRTEKIREKEKF